MACREIGYETRPDLQPTHAPLSRAPREPSNIVGGLSVRRLHIQQCEKPSTTCNCMLNFSVDFQAKSVLARLYTFMYIKWLQHVQGSNTAQIIDILNVSIHRALQFMMWDEFVQNFPVRFPFCK
jgi:hypothetical protein